MQIVPGIVIGGKGVLYGASLPEGASVTERYRGQACITA